MANTAEFEGRIGLIVDSVRFAQQQCTCKACRISREKLADFLQDKISFYRIMEAVSEVVDRLNSARTAHTLDDIIGYDREARALARTILSK